VEDTIIREKLGLALSWRRNPKPQRKKPAGRQLRLHGEGRALPRSPVPVAAPDLGFMKGHRHAKR
jgi:hypothetical protein